jgi:hypothetical protein
MRLHVFRSCAVDPTVEEHNLADVLSSLTLNKPYCLSRLFHWYRPSNSLLKQTLNSPSLRRHRYALTHTAAMSSIVELQPPPLSCALPSVPKIVIEDGASQERARAVFLRSTLWANYTVRLACGELGGRMGLSRLNILTIISFP